MPTRWLRLPLEGEVDKAIRETFDIGDVGKHVSQLSMLDDPRDSGLLMMQRSEP